MQKYSIVRNILRMIIPAGFKRFFLRLHAFYHWDEFRQNYWSQEGEDIILQRIFNYKASGFYVDVGAHHPERFSNTYLFYKRGWQGINIDPLPGSMQKFNKKRPRDINIECGVGPEHGFLTYYMFNEPALNGFSKELSEIRHQDNNDYKILEQRNVMITPLKNILNEKISKNQKIDFLTVDVEGFDLQVLKSNDWRKYRPEYVLVEILESCYSNLNNNPIVDFMLNNEYSIFAKSANTIFFKNNQNADA